MIALDASAVIEMLRGGPLADSLWEELLRSGEPPIAPHLIDIEAVSALRRLALENRIDSHRAEQSVMALELLPA